MNSLKKQKRHPVRRLSLEEFYDFQPHVLLAMFDCWPYLKGLSVVQGLERGQVFPVPLDEVRQPEEEHSPRPSIHRSPGAVQREGVWSGQSVVTQIISSTLFTFSAEKWLFPWAVMVYVLISKLTNLFSSTKIPKRINEWNSDQTWSSFDSLVNVCLVSFLDLCDDLLSGRVDGRKRLAWYGWVELIVDEDL